MFLKYKLAIFRVCLHVITFQKKKASPAARNTLFPTSYSPFKATTSISTSAPWGRAATWTADLAG